MNVLTKFTISDIELLENWDLYFFLNIISFIYDFNMMGQVDLSH